MNYINRYINSHSAYLYRYQECITVVYSYATHVRVQFMNMKYIKKSHRLCKSKAMLLCVFFAKMVLPSLMLNILSAMFLCDCVCKREHIAVGFTFYLYARNPDSTQNTAGKDICYNFHI